MANTGFKLAGTGTSVQAGAELSETFSIQWTNPGNITAIDTSDAVADAAGGSGLSYFLRASNFDFSTIPAGAHIDGFRVRVNNYFESSVNWTWSHTRFTLFDSTAQQYMGNDLNTTDMPQPSGSDQTGQWGETDKRNESIVNADVWQTLYLDRQTVVDPDFGAAVVASMGVAGSETMNVDAIEMDVYYHEGFPSPIGSATEMGGGKRGPWLYNGYVYALASRGRPGNRLSAITVVRTQNPDQGDWEELDVGSTSEESVGNGWNVSNACAAQVSGNLLHLVRVSDFDQHVYYRQFNLSTNTWVTGSDATFLTGGILQASAVDIHVISNSDIYVIYNGDADRVMGGDKLRVDYAHWNGTAWTANQALDAAGDIHYGSPVVCAGNGADDVHFAWLRETNAANDPPVSWSDIQGRTHLGSGGLDGTTDTFALSNITAAAKGVSLRSMTRVAGTIRAYIAELTSGDLGFVLGTETGANNIIDFTSDGQDTDTIGIDSNTGYTGLDGSVFDVIYDATASKYYMVHSDPSTDDLYYRESTDGTTWSASVEIQDAVGRCDEISINVYTRGSVVLAVLYADGAVTHYTEYTLAGGSNDASGSPSIPAITSSGSSTVKKIATGAATIAAITAAGVASFVEDASGAATLQPITSAGAADVSVLHSASGSPSLQPVTSTGASEVVKPASGAASIPAITSAGSATVVKGASGAATLELITSGGVAERIEIGSGSPTLQPITSTGVAGVSASKTASGAATLQPITATGASFIHAKVWLNTTQTLAGATEMTVTGASSDGTELTFSDPVGVPTGALYLGVENRNTGDVGWIAVTVSPAAADQTASGAASITAVTSSGAAEIIKPSSGAASIGAITSAGSAEIIKPASGSATLQAVTSSGVAIDVETASGAATLQAITSAGSAELTGAHSSSGAATLQAITSAGVATDIETASGAATLQAITSAGSAELAGAHSSSGAATLQAITSTGVAIDIETASGAASIQPIASTGVAEIIKPASGSASIAALTSTGAAEVVNSATGAASIEAITSAGVAEIIKPSSGSATLQAITSTGVSEVAGAHSSSGSASLQPVTSSGAASFVLASSGGASLSPITSAGVAGVAGAKSASGSPSLDAITSSGVAEIAKPASGAATLQPVTSSGAAEIVKTAAGAASIAALTSSGVAEIVKPASGSVSIQSVTSSGSAEIVKPASGSASIQALTSAGVANAAGNFSSSGSPSIQAIISTGSARVLRSATGSPSIQAITSSGSASLREALAASGAVSIQALTSTGSAAFIWQPSGAATLQPITSGGVSEVQRIAGGAASIPAITSTGVAVISKPSSGAVSLQAITSAGSVRFERSAAASATLQPITSAGVVVNTDAPRYPGVEFVILTDAIEITILTEETVELDVRADLHEINGFMDA